MNFVRARKTAVLTFDCANAYVPKSHHLGLTPPLFGPAHGFYFFHFSFVSEF